MTNQKPKRESKRVKWQPEGAPVVGEEPPADIFTPETSDAQAPSSQSNDERLRADKPPHWG